MEDELPAGARGVELLVAAAQTDASLLEGPDHLDELPQGSSQAVQPLHDEDVPRPEAVEDVSQLRPISPSLAGTLDEDPVAAGGGEFVDLKVGF